MTFYILLAIVLIFVSLMARFSRPADRVLFDGCIFLTFFLVAAIRYNVGSDFDTYRLFYIDPSPDDNLELIYYVINYILRFFHLPYSAFFAYTALGSLIPIWLGAKKNGPFFYVSILLFLLMGFYTESLNIVRNFIAVGIIFYYGYDQLTKRSIKGYLFVILVASLFHMSALFCIPLYFFAHRRYSLWVMGATIAIAFALNGGFLIDQITAVLSAMVPERYAGYIQYLPQYISELNEPFWLRIVNNVDKIVILSILYAYRKRLMAIDRNNLILINIAFFNLVFTFFSRGIGPLQRMGLYLSIFSILSTALLIHLGRGKVQKAIIAICLISVYFIYFIVVILLKNLGEVIPYQTIFGF